MLCRKMGDVGDTLVVAAMQSLMPGMNLHVLILGEIMSLRWIRCADIL